MSSILQQLYIKTKDGATPIFSNNKCIEVAFSEEVTATLLNTNYSEYDTVVDTNANKIYTQYENGKWSVTNKLD